MSVRARCDACGFETDRDSDEWTSVDHPSLGSLQACPECGSTRIHGLSDTA